MERLGCCPANRRYCAGDCKSLETPLRFGLLQLSPFGRQRHSDRTGAWPEAVHGPILSEPTAAAADVAVSDVPVVVAGLRVRVPGTESSMPRRLPSRRTCARTLESTI